MTLGSLLLLSTQSVTAITLPVRRRVRSLSQQEVCLILIIANNKISTRVVDKRSGDYLAVDPRVHHTSTRTHNKAWCLSYCR